MQFRGTDPNAPADPSSYPNGQLPAHRNTGPAASTSIGSALQSLTGLRRPRGGASASEPAVSPRDEQPLRGDLYSVDQLAQHARTLAGWHEVDAQPANGAPETLLPRLEENERVLERAYDEIVRAAEKGRHVTPAAEWLIDNFYLIQEQIRLAKRHLPRGYARELPRLKNGPNSGRPRVYDLAHELIRHVDGQVDATALTRFVEAYQSVQPLRLGELWGVPIMLRIALLENLRRVAARVAAGQADQDLAAAWAGRILSSARRDPKAVVRVLAELYEALERRPDAPAEGKGKTEAIPSLHLSSAFVTEFARRLQGQGQGTNFPLEWLAHALGEQGASIDGMAIIESQRQAADQVSVGNSIGTLRFIQSHDWSLWVEGLSAVEAVLRRDPADAYADSTFATRDHYRHVVEDVADRADRAETEVAQLAVEAAKSAGTTRDADAAEQRRGHVGYALIDAGRPALERAAGARAGLRGWFRSTSQRARVLLFVGFVALVAAAGTIAAIWWSLDTALPLAAAILLALPLLIAASQPAVNLANWVIGVLVPPRPLPRLDYKLGIPAGSRSIVAVPTMLGSVEAGLEQVEGLELRYLTNRDEHLHFALLTDWPDADAAEESGDRETVAAVVDAVERLNRRYGFEAGEKFMLFHRPRRWNESEGVWMGWERKRGKLSEFNRLLRPCHADADRALKAFDTTLAQRELLFGVKYVVALDADTELPAGAARQLVGTMDHPLNHPVWDDEKGRVVAGYGILQPRVGTGLTGSRASWYARMMGGDAGIDPYTLAVSDVYQDAFDEGSFVGKGIYHADLFERACGERFPENTVLSHDLIESGFARSGLASDVVLYEDYPASYVADMARRHRWIRGDWQIARYALPWLGSEKNHLSALSRWKLFDNLRRSLVAPAIVLTLLVACLARPHGFWAWTLLLVGYFFLPPLLAAAVGTVRTAFAGDDEDAELRVTAIARSLRGDLARAGMNLAFLPFEAYRHVDAIARTLYRLWVSRRHLLEWQTAADAERKARRDHWSFWETMWPGWILALGLIAYLTGWGAWTSLAVFAPIALAWGSSPTLAFLLSRPTRRSDPATTLPARDRRFLRKLSRRTWSFFERFVAAADHFLPPDNYQEVPEGRVASRTSPTNIGLALLSNLAAWDFGYTTLGQTLDRTKRTLDTMGRLERHESGHFFNWYDTRRLAPLTPRYISSVDSGNLVASLHVARSGLLDLVDQPAIAPQAWAGMVDVIRLFRDTCEGREVLARPDDLRAADDADEPSPPAKVKLPGDLRRTLDALVAECESGGPAKLSGAKLLLQKLAVGASDCVAAVAASGHGEARRWAGEFERQAARFAEELHHLCPWVDLVAPSRPYEPADLASRARLRQLESSLAALEAYPTLRQVAELAEAALPAAEKTVDEVEHATLRPHVDLAYFRQLHRVLGDAAARARHRIAELNGLAAQCEDFAQAQWDLLYDKGRDLLTIGYNVTERRRDAGYYDLLASEMRLGSYVLIATGQLPQKHWFSLGRQLTSSGRHSALISWSGSMFEYLMPLMLMPSHEGTLLDETYRGVIDRQKGYARNNGIKAGVPWGVSESGYAAIDAEQTYQYRPFGVPGLGYKRGLGEDLVIAPYASMMGVMVDAPASVANLRRLRDEGKMGEFGFYEAIDYTPTRVKRGQSESIVRQWMVHHQAMGFLSMASALLGEPMQRRLLREPAFRSADLLLQERVPLAKPVYPHAGEHAGSRRAEHEAVGTLRVFTTPHTPTPEVHLLSNKRLAVMVSAAGGGYTRWDADGDGTNAMAVTRWQEDATRDCWGTFVYVRDVETGQFWSNAYQPTLRKPLRYEAIFSQARAEYRRYDRIGDDADAGPLDARPEIETYTQISVSTEDDVEVRRITLTNNGREPRTLELTSYAEPVLADPQADAAHPAFQNLFVQTRLVRGRQAILAKRRARSEDERTPYLLHLMTCYGTEVGEPQYETDRSAFVGRGRSLVSPLAMQQDRLGDASGSVVDPIVSVRRTVRLEPGEKAVFDVVTGVAETHEEGHGLIERYHDRRLCDRVGELAWTHTQVTLRQLGIDESDAQTYGRLASSVIYATPQRRAAAAEIARNVKLQRKQSNLWAYGLSGDWPIVLVRVGDLANVSLVVEAVKAHAYWRRKKLKCDLVILNEDNSGYRNEVNDAIMAAIAKAGEQAVLEKPGGIFVKRGEQFAEEDRTLLMALARVLLTDKAGSLADQLDRRMTVEPTIPRFAPAQPRAGRAPLDASELPEHELMFKNGIGGFTPDGKEYITTTTLDQPTPAPWSNVMANPNFGTLVTESGGGYTWRTNAREYRLTPFYNDPVGDTSGEATYLRDEETGEFWSLSPLPARGTMPYVTRHGFGYTVFEYSQSAIRSETTVFVHRHEPVKFTSVKLTNDSDRPRRVSVTAYAEWVLSDQRAKGAMHTVTGVDPQTGAVTAQNPYNAEFGHEVAFLDCSESTRTVTGDRLEFLGRNGTPAKPAALRRTKLSGKVGAGLDPCAAMRIPVELGPGEEREIVFVFGAGNDADHARALCKRFANSNEARLALEENWGFWGRTLGTLYIETPDPAVNVLANGWLEYQVLSCRYWGRTGFYQSGGAYGFRDQLQDVAALLWCEPSLIREHLLRAAHHQFKEGDVLHWWHPPSGRGVRTHFSDDYMWLPLIAARYVTATGDTGVLDEEATFLEGPPVPAEQESVYDGFPSTGGVGTLYEHCKRSILNGIERRGYGTHGLPLIGCGDWNDGMNLIGEDGRGESVWLAWFFVSTLLDFAKVAEVRGDGEFANRCRAEADTLRNAVETTSWDGEWYRRAYFDNGEPLGSHTNPECQIDSLPQSWSVLCERGDPDRAAQAMSMVDQRLVRPEKRLIQLFDPPFDDSDLNPGYIKGYVPGVRENGGQYTHAAIWVVMAFAKMGDARRAWELFDLINPVNHAATPGDMATYKVEPYVVAADVYGVEPHVGRGGWTWYTGSAGWMLRLMVEHLLGLRMAFENGQARLYVEPLLPEGWDGYKVSYRHRDTHHHITVHHDPSATGPTRFTIDGQPQPEPYLRLREDNQPHQVEIYIGG